MTGPFHRSISVFSKEELQDRRAKRATSSSEGARKLYDDLTARSGEASTNLDAIVERKTKSLLETAHEISDSEFCLEPDDIVLLVRDEQLPIERMDHFASCSLCQEIVSASKSIRAAEMGQKLADEAARGLMSEIVVVGTK